MTAVTAVTVQNTTGVKSIVPIPPKEIYQIKLYLLQKILNQMQLKLECYILQKL